MSLAVVGIGLAALQVRYAAWPVVPEPPAPTASLEDAIALATNGRSAEAVEVFKRLAAADPKNPVVHANACGLYLEMNYLVEARQACLTAVLNGGSNWLANYNNACLLAREGRINEAIEALRQALATVGNDAAAKLTRASLAQRATGDPMLQNLRGNAQFKTLTATR